MKKVVQKVGGVQAKFGGVRTPRPLQWLRPCFYIDKCIMWSLYTIAELLVRTPVSALPFSCMSVPA